MTILWYYLLPLIAFLSVEVSKKSLPENVYPDWFFESPAALSIGYSDERSYVDSAIKSAAREAAVNYVKSQRVRIVGEQGMATFAVGKIPIGSTIKELYDENEAARLGESMVAVDLFLRGRTVTVLASPDSSKTVTVSKRIDAAKTAKPSWVNIVPDKPGFMYSTGLAPVYYYENNSWREAERKARINLALSLYTKVKLLQKKVDNEYYREYSVEETNVTLRGMNVVSRWKDVKNRICYVLVRMPVGK
jgi:hypothetical protein